MVGKLDRIARALGALLMTGCAAGGIGEATGDPVPDPAGFVESLRGSSIPPGPRQVTFQWTLDEGGSRVRGRGVVRIEAPVRIRLDLFGPRDETYLIAALVGDEYRFPTPAAPAVQLPSPSLLWAALGVFEPPAGVPLLGATTSVADADVRFGARGDEIFVYTFEPDAQGGYRLVGVERAGSRGVLESVGIERDAGGEVDTTRYRDWSAFRDLVLEAETARAVDSFPPSIWRPGAEAP